MLCMCYPSECPQNQSFNIPSHSRELRLSVTYTTQSLNYCTRSMCEPCVIPSMQFNIKWHMSCSTGRSPNPEPRGQTDPFNRPKSQILRQIILPSCRVGINRWKVYYELVKSDLPRDFLTAGHDDHRPVTFDATPGGWLGTRCARSCPSSDSETKLMQIGTENKLPPGSSSSIDRRCFAVHDKNRQQERGLNRQIATGWNGN